MSLMRPLIALLLGGSTLATAAQAQTTAAAPIAVGASATDVTAFVPKNWRLAAIARGDLNADGSADVAFVLHGTDPAKIQLGRDLGGDGPGFDGNPNLVAVALFDPATKAYVIRAVDAEIIPARPSANIEDHFEGIEIAKGVLQLRLSLFASMGGWTTERRSLTFRVEQGAVRLIGLDSNEVARNTGAMTARSINYATGRMSIETGSISDTKPGRKRWKTLPKTAPRLLGGIGDGIALELPS